MDDASIKLERSIKAMEFRDRWHALGFTTRPRIASEVGVSDEAVKTWETCTRPIPRYAWRSLERLEAIKKPKARK